ncbi:hypothetical protein [Luteimonas lutimaris]|uniref:Glycosyltransferase RgtA/B/C/D-like domain-containing protein n=1 Tax=Luteimonas lutimaris TaxID=698645 RepID=A0ABP7MYB1_9GAMM
MSQPTKLSVHADKHPSRPARLPLAWVIVAAVIVATFYPGIMSNDSIASLEQARTLEFTSWHPPIMAIIWSVLDRIVEGPVLMLAVQAALYAIAAAKLCTEAFPGLVRKFTPWLVIPLFSLFPPVMTLNGMIWKDVWMSALLLLALAYLFRMARADSSKSRLHAFFVVLTGCLFATAFRHNAVAATAGLLAGAFYFMWPDLRPWLRLLRACVCGVLLAIGLMLLVSTLVRLVAQPAHVTTPILMHDIAGMIVNSKEPWRAARVALAVSPALSDTSPHEFTQAIKRRYTPAAAGQILRTSRRPDAPFAINVYRLDHDADAVKQAWLALIKEEPAAYLTHRAKAFACLLQLCDRREWAQHSYILNPRYVAPEGNGPMQGTLRTLLVRPGTAWMYSPAFWLALVLAGGAYGLARPRERPLLVFMGLSGLGLAVSLFFTSPIESYRYMHWVVVMGWTMAWLLLGRLLQPNQAASPD